VPNLARVGKNLAKTPNLKIKRRVLGGFGVFAYKLTGVFGVFHL
jgi:hypothetical protein